MNIMNSSASFPSIFVRKHPTVHCTFSTPCSTEQEGFGQSWPDKDGFVRSEHFGVWQWGLPWTGSKSLPSTFHLFIFFSGLFLSTTTLKTQNQMWWGGTLRRKTNKNSISHHWTSPLCGTISLDQHVFLLLRNPEGSRLVPWSSLSQFYQITALGVFKTTKFELKMPRLSFRLWGCWAPAQPGHIFPAVGIYSIYLHI